MSILNTTTDPATAAANAVRSIARQQFVSLYQAGNRGYNFIWKNPNATPQQVIAALGTDAAVVFQLAGLNITTVASAASIGNVPAPTIPEIPSNYTVSFNLDGSATVTQSSGSGSGSGSGS